MKKYFLFLTLSLIASTTMHASGKKQQYRLRQKQKARACALRQLGKKEKQKEKESERIDREVALEGDGLDFMRDALLTSSGMPPLASYKLSEEKRQCYSYVYASCAVGAFVAFFVGNIIEATSQE